MHIGKKTLFLLSFFVIGLIIGTREVVKKQSLSSMKAWSTFSELPPIEEIQVSKVPQNNINNDIIQNNETYVPSYWKYGVNTDSQDYLKGYLPNIRNFKEYWNIYINSLYGTTSSYGPFSAEEIFSYFEENNNYRQVNGIKNESSYFKWNKEDCKTFFSSTLNGNIHICKNWVNWTAININDKDFVLVDCELNKTKGYCIYEDYAKIYYNSKRYGESRCFGETDLYCDYEKYINNIH